MGFILSIGAYNFDKCEAWAVFKGFTLVWDKIFYQVVVECDLEAIFKWLTLDDMAQGLMLNLLETFKHVILKVIEN